MVRNKKLFVTVVLAAFLVGCVCFATGCSSGEEKNGPVVAETAKDPDRTDSQEALPQNGTDGGNVPEDEALPVAENVTEAEQPQGSDLEPERPQDDDPGAGSEPEGAPREPADSEPEPEHEPEPEPDTEPPVFKEYRSHLVYIGDTVSYRGGVVLTDNSGEEPVLTIDSSQVNLKEPGEYPLTYTATDAAGNSSTCEVTVVVRERVEITQEMLDEKADEIIEKILGGAGRDRDSLETLFKWTRKNVRYVNYFEQNDDISAAWEGLEYGRGDCYVFACVSKELLTRAGFKNDMIRTSRHFWNLVDLGEGWYHYDTCPRKDKPYFFMWGDTELMEYSKNNGNSHDYDHSKWPDVMP